MPVRLLRIKANERGLANNTCRSDFFQIKEKCINENRAVNVVDLTLMATATS